jgi:hypothetical protein
MTAESTAEPAAIDDDGRQTRRQAGDLPITRGQMVGQPAAPAGGVLHQVWPAPLSLGPTVPLPTSALAVNTAKVLDEAAPGAEANADLQPSRPDVGGDAENPATAPESAGAASQTTDGAGNSGGGVASWPLCLLALPAGVAAWSGWVGLGAMTGFGRVHPLPGIADGLQINTAITLPVGVEAYAAYAMSVWLGQRQVSSKTRRFACFSALGALVLGGCGQVAYHLLENAHAAKVAQVAHDTHRAVADVARQLPAQAPWWITTAVACLPVIVLGLAAALAHMVRHESHGAEDDSAEDDTTAVGTDTELATDANETGGRPNTEPTPATPRPVRAANKPSSTANKPSSTANKPSSTANKPSSTANITTATNVRVGANTTATTTAPRRANTDAPVAPPAAGFGRANMGRQEAANRAAPISFADGRRNSTPHEGQGKRGMFREQMRDFWDSEIEKGRIPSGADLNRAAGRDPGYSLGKKYARQWRAELPAPAEGRHQ